MRLWARIARGFLQQAFIFPVMTLVYGLKVSGRENLAGLSGPVLFAANHHLGLDNPLIFKAVTRKWRRRLAVAAAAELWRNPVWWVLNPLLGNGIPHRPGRPDQTQPGKLGRNHGTRVVRPALSGRRADYRRTHETLYAGRRAYCSRGVESLLSPCVWKLHASAAHRGSHSSAVDMCKSYSDHPSSSHPAPTTNPQPLP